MNNLWVNEYERQTVNERIDDQDDIIYTYVVNGETDKLLAHVDNICKVAVDEIWTPLNFGKDREFMMSWKDSILSQVQEVVRDEVLKRESWFGNEFSFIMDKALNAIQSCYHDLLAMK